MRFSWILYCLVVFSCKPVPSVDSGTITRVDTVYVDKPLSDRDVYVDTLKNYLGLREATGNNDGYHIDKFNAICGFKNSPWCGAVLSYGLKVNGLEIPEQPCYTPSFFPAERIVWRSGQEKELMKGDIFGLYFSSMGRIAHAGALQKILKTGGAQP